MSLVALLDIGMKLIDKIIPDPEQKAKAQLDLLALQQSGELKALESDTQMLLAQAETNKIEAASDDPFTRRWRPFIGWVCGAAFCYHFILQPLLILLLAVGEKHITPPDFDMETLNTVLFGMLGLGTMRTVEKWRKK